MSAFAYLIAEGVHDVAFLGKVLAVQWSASRVRRRSDLDEVLGRWVSSFKWPPGEHIDRLAVPAPHIYRVALDLLVALRNAGGADNISGMLEDDLDALSRYSAVPGAIGILLDNDDRSAEGAFMRLRDAIDGFNLPAPSSLGEVVAGPPRVGVFALPAPGIPGTLEDLLIALGDVAYPELSAAARAYADEWRRRADADPDAEDWRELRKTAGTKKATIGAMAAILKPGTPSQVSLEANRWVSEQTKEVACIQPCLWVPEGAH
jgi:hypothetical protein